MEVTMGRIVYYRDFNGEVRPAIVNTAIGGEEQIVNLTIFYPLAIRHQIGVVHDQTGEKNNTWHWMEYQMKQAQKAEEEARDTKKKGVI